MIIKQCKDDYCLILNDKLIVYEKDQLEFIEWLWKNKPQLVAKAIVDPEEQLSKFIDKEAIDLQRWQLNWLSINKPELIKEYYEKVMENDKSDN